MKDSQKEFFAARVDPEVLETLKAAAEARGVRVSAIAREAFDLYIREVIENRCPVCEAANPRGADWCGSCGAAMTRAAAGEIWQEAKRAMQGHDAMVQQIADMEKQTEALAKKVDSVVNVTRGLWRANDEEIPPSARPRPPGEQNIISEEQT